MSTVYVECPRKPGVSLYEMLGELRSHETYAPVKPYQAAHAAAWARYEREIVAEAKLHAAQKATIIKPDTSPFFICGAGIAPEPFCPCGHTAEILCDHPMGRGTTCDLPLCWCCSKHIAEDLDLCLIHFAEFVGRTGVERVNPWPPPRKR